MNLFVDSNKMVCPFCGKTTTVEVSRHTPREMCECGARRYVNSDVWHRLIAEDKEKVCALSNQNIKAAITLEFDATTESGMKHG